MIGAVLLTGVFSNLAGGLLQGEGVPPQAREQVAVALEDANGQVPPDDGDTVLDGLPDIEAAELVAIAETAQVDAMKDAVTWTGGFVLVAMLVATFLPGRQKRAEAPPPEPRALLK
ncbi:MAG: hypothetical protein AAGK32_18910 [Actinomycetota bacterium]